jgi:hypothetical protein
MDARRMDEGTHEGTETMDSSTKGKVPRYMLPSFTSILPDYANSEADKIRQVTLLRPPVTPPLRLTPRPHRPGTVLPNGKLRRDIQDAQPASVSSILQFVPLHPLPLIIAVTGLSPSIEHATTM